DRRPARDDGLLVEAGRLLPYFLHLVREPKATEVRPVLPERAVDEVVRVVLGAIEDVALRAVRHHAWNDRPVDLREPLGAKRRQVIVDLHHLDHPAPPGARLRSAAMAAAAGLRNRIF